MNQRTIGVVGPSIAGDFIIAALTGIYEVAREQGDHVLVIQGTPRIIAERDLARRRVSGWIVVVDADGIEALADGGQHGAAPVVLIGATAGPRFPAVLPDNRHGIRELMDHLLGHGHERFAFVGNLRNQDMAERFETFKAVLAERGLAFDPARVLDIDGYTAGETESAMRRFLASPPDYTAIVAAADAHASGALSALTEAGIRVPEDMALVGFDDIPAAQHFHPPLTTIRQQPDELGRQAARILSDLIGGRQPAQPVTWMPTTLVQRRSCGCQTADERIRELAAAAVDPAVDWRAALAGQLLRLLYYPQSVPQGGGRQSVPGALPVRLLVDALAASAADAPGAEPADLERAWGEIAQVNGGATTLFAMQQALEQASGRIAAAERRDDLLQRSRFALLNARLELEHRRAADLSRLVISSYHISLVLAAEQMSRSALLGWLEHTGIHAGVLALWPGGGAAEDADHSALRAESVFWRSGAAPISQGATFAPAEFPPAPLLANSLAEGQPTYAVILPITTPKRDWGVLALNDPANDLLSTTMATMSMWLTILGAALDRAALEDSLLDEREQLRGAYERERALAGTVRELGCSLLPILPGLVLVPLVGGIDERRAEQIVDVVLRGVSGAQAEVVVIDISGVPVVDTQVVGSLVQTATAATLLGVRVALVGIRPEVAQSMVGLRADLGAIRTFSSLAGALEWFLQSRGRRA
ncbi:MAG TPA: substrate-binding domain-containing protein [Herpetosiphonaceae bacterium]